MKILPFLSLLIIPFFGFSQEKTNSKGGEIELGVRNTLSTFGSTENTGYGFGGQFRIRISNKLNTEWFADFIAEDIDGIAKRNDYHIGWSVMFYPFNPENKKVTPYILAGHCFDYTKISAVQIQSTENIHPEASRLSSATQVGIGTQFHLSEQFNLSVSSQYMVHLGQDLHTEVHYENGIKELHVEKEGHGESLSLEGHILFTISLNYKIADLW
jgi:hypothetical protein